MSDMSEFPLDDDKLDALFRGLSNPDSVLFAIVHARQRQPSMGNDHPTEDVVARYRKNVDQYVETVVRATRRFENKTR